jgi:ferrous iron transport protein A
MSTLATNSKPSPKNGTTLAQMPTNSEGPIVSLEGDAIVVSRLRELGFIIGETVRIAGRAPFGEPILIEIRGATVALRKSEAACVHL